MITNSNTLKILVLSVVVLLSITLVSCVAPSVKDDSKISPNNCIDTENLAECAVDLYESLYPDMLRSGETLQVGDISYMSGTDLWLRSGAERTPEIGVCAINFKDNKGFVLMTTGSISTPIAIIEEGNFNFNHSIHTVQDSLLYSAIESFLVQLEKIMKSDFHLINRAGFQVVELISHKLKTKLNQEGPYFIPYRPTDVAGCVPVAIAQILIYYKTITWEIGGNKVDWQGIEDECEKNNGEMTDSSPQHIKEELNRVLWWIGKKSKSHYGNRSTSTFSSKALNLIRKNGFVVNPRMYDYDIAKVREGLLENKITYMDGGRSQRYFLFWTWPDDAHAWLADGYAKIKDSHNNTFEMIHINWGWGNARYEGIVKGDPGYNGYFRDNIFDPYSPDAIHTNPLRDAKGSTQYKYNIEMTHVYPKQARR